MFLFQEKLASISAPRPEVSPIACCSMARGVVYAVDVTPEQMVWRLQQDARVRQIKQNARNLRPEQIPEPADLVTVDVSFISVVKVLPAP